MRIFAAVESAMRNVVVLASAVVLWVAMVPVSLQSQDPKVTQEVLKEVIAEGISISIVATGVEGH